jgi:hypothetical protein
VEKKAVRTRHEDRFTLVLKHRTWLFWYAWLNNSFYEYYTQQPALIQICYDNSTQDRVYIKGIYLLITFWCNKLTNVKLFFVHVQYMQSSAAAGADMGVYFGPMSPVTVFLKKVNGCKMLLTRKY